MTARGEPDQDQIRSASQGDQLRSNVNACVILICLLVSVLLAKVECAGNEAAHALRGNVGMPMGPVPWGRPCNGTGDCSCTMSLHSGFGPSRGELGPIGGAS